MDRIATTFSEQLKEKDACFIAYVCAGDPDYNTSLNVCRTLIESGIDILELGVPFTDPLADGLTNQLAAQRALESGMKQQEVFKLVSEIRKFSQIPIVFYTYYNLVFSPGMDNYLDQAKEAGVDALLTLDCPPEESGELLAACQKRDIKNIFIVAPTTPPERIKKIADVASGFIYYVSREGVTGERTTLADNLKDAVSEIKKHASVPVVVGFGISTPEHVKEVASIADGVVVGSAIVNCIANNTNNPQKIVEDIAEKTKYLLQGLN